MRISGVFLLVVAVAAVGCHKPVHNNLPPGEMLAHPGPGMDGPGPGISPISRPCRWWPLHRKYTSSGPKDSPSNGT